MPTLTSKTADPDAWPGLLKEIDSYESICLKPASESSSPDIIFATKAWFDSKAVRLRIAIAAKNYLTSELTETGINSEIEKADQRLSATAKSQDFESLNVLFICSTNYGTSVQKSFARAKFFQIQHQHIHEIIVLDLSSKENRVKFFGLNEDWMVKTVEDVIKKRISAVFA